MFLHDMPSSYSDNLSLGAFCVAETTYTKQANVSEDTIHSFLCVSCVVPADSDIRAV